MRTQTLAEPPESTLLNLKRIMVPTDFSDASNAAYRYAVRFAQQFGAELHVIHILEPAFALEFAGLPPAPVFSDGEAASAKKKLRTWVGSMGAMGVSAKTEVRHGLSAHEIVEAAKDLDVDLIIIATHGYVGWKHFCIGSTAEQVVRAAPCPVLVVREKEHQFC